MKQEYIVEAVLSARDGGMAAAFKGVNEEIKKTDDLADEAEKSSGGLREQLKSFGPTAAIIAGVTIAFQKLAQYVGKATERLDSMDNFSRTIKIMTGSAEEAEIALKNVTDTVSGTAYGLDAAAGAVSGLVTAGVDVEKATRYVGGWADAVSVYGDGTSDTLSRVTYALNKASAKGKVSLEELNVAMEAGIPVQRLLAEATGKSVEQISDDISKGKISTEEFLEVMDKAFREGTSSFAGIEGAAKNAGSTWKGTMDNSAAAITRGVASIIQAFEDGRESANLPGAKEAIIGFAKGVEGALKGVAVVVGALAPHMELLSRVVVTGFLAFNGYKIANQAADAIKKFGSQSLVAGQEVTIAQTILLVFQGRLTATGAAAGIAKAGLSGLWTTMKANPVGATVAAITIAVSALGALNDFLNGVSDEHKAANEEAKAHAAQLNNLSDAAATSGETLSRTIKDISSNGKGAREVVKAMKEIESSSADATEKATRLEAETKKLKDIYPDLEVSVDAATGSIEGGTDALLAQVNAMEDAARTDAMKDQLKDLYKQQSDLSYAFEEGTEKMRAMEEQGEDTTAVLFGFGEKSAEGYKELAEAMGMTEEQMVELEAQISALEEELRLQSEAELEAQLATEAHARSVEGLNEAYGVTSDAILQYAEQEGLALDEAGEKILELAEEFNVSTDQIVEDALRQNIGIKDLQKHYEELAKEEEALEQLTSKFNLTTDSVIQSAQTQGMSIQELADAYESSLSRATDSILNYVEQGINGFQLIEQEQTISFDELVANMEANAIAMANWSSNIAELIRLGVNEGVISQLQEMGPAGAEQTQLLVDELSGADGPENLERINAAYANLVDEGVKATQNEEALAQMSEGGRQQAQSYAQGIINEQFGVETASQEMVKKGVNAVVSHTEANSGQVITSGAETAQNYEAGVNQGANESTYSNLVNSVNPAFDEIETKAGTSSSVVKQTISDGTADATANASANTKQMADETGENFDQMAKESADGMMSMNEAVDENLANTQQSMQDSYAQMLIDSMDAYRGIKSVTKDGMQKTATAVEDGMSRMISAANRAVNGMTNAGYNAGEGFNRGLSSTRGRILGTARSIANGVVSTINRALNMHSPSKALEKSGINTGLGYDLGLAKTQDGINQTALSIARDVESVMSASGRSDYGMSAIDRAQAGIRSTINLVMGGHEWTTHVEDITGTQDHEARLKLSYS